MAAKEAEYRPYEARKEEQEGKPQKLKRIWWLNFYEQNQLTNNIKDDADYLEETLLHMIPSYTQMTSLNVWDRAHYWPHFKDKETEAQEY